MAIVPQTYMSRADLTYFNDTVNERIKRRLKYKGDFEITSEQTDWDALSPTEIAHVYCLTSENIKKITIDDVLYNVGDWIIVTNKTIKNDDGSIVDEDGNPTHVQVKKLGSAGIADGEDDGDGLVYVDGEWKIQKDYGYYKPNFDGIDVSGLEILPSGGALVGEYKLIEGVEYTVSINDTEIGSYTAIVTPGEVEEPHIDFEDGSTWNSIYSTNGYMWILGHSHIGETISLKLAGEIEGEYIKFDKRYIPSTLPEDANPGDAIIFDGSDWTKQSNYGFVSDFGSDHKTICLVRAEGLGRGCAMVKLGPLTENEQYTVKIGDDEFTGTAVEENGKLTISFDGESTKLRKIVDNGEYLEFHTGGDYLWNNLEIEVIGELGSRVFTIDPQYIPIPSGHDYGDANVWFEDKWTIQKNYGYYEPGVEEVTQDVFITLNGDGLVDIKGFVPGNTYKITIGDDFEQNVVADGVGNITFYDNPLWEKIIKIQGGHFLISKDIGQTSARTFTVGIEGQLKGDYYEFDRRYIPAPVRIKETNEDLPYGPDDDSIREGDVFYVRRDMKDMVLERYALKPEAVDAGWTVAWYGLVGPEERLYTWEQAAANDELVQDTLIDNKIDEGDICRVKLSNGTIIYDKYDEFVTHLGDYCDQTAYIYDKYDYDYRKIFSKDDLRNTNVPIDRGFIIDLHDNLFDE